MKTLQIKQENSIKTQLKTAAPIFVFLLCYNFIVTKRCQIELLDGITYLFHCVDFSLGFCSRFLPGAVYNLFVSAPSQLSATVYEYILLLIFSAALSLILAKWLTAADKKYSADSKRLLLIFLTGSCTFSIYFCEPGMLDFYWVAISLLFIVCLRSNILRFLCPLLTVPCCMVHPGVMLCYVPFFALLLLYEHISSETKKDKKIYLALFALTCIFSIAAFSYFTLCDKKNVTVDIYEFNDIIEERGGDTENTYFLNYLFLDPDNIEDYLAVTGKDSYMENPFTERGEADGIKGLINAVIYQIELHLAFYKDSFYKCVFIEPLAELLILLPAIIMLYGFAVKKFKESKGNKLSRFFYLCMLFQLPLALFGSLLISTDSMRWLSHGYTLMFALALYIIYREKGADLRGISAYFGRFPAAAKTVWHIIYALVILSPYV